jgi:hypothetical protein
VDREDWRFVYSDQMLGRAYSGARQHISHAAEFAKDVAMPVHYTNNVSGYLSERGEARFSLQGQRADLGYPLAMDSALPPCG